MDSLPTGTVTFLFTDIESSTKLAQSHADKWESLRARHHAILKSAIESNNGYVFQIIGDAFCASFHTAVDAVRAAAQAQTNFHNEDWGDTPVKIRIGINTGTAQASVDTDHSGGYKGYTAMARVQRIMSAGHGGQVLVSQTTRDLVFQDLPKGASLRDLGDHPQLAAVWLVCGRRARVHPRRGVRATVAVTHLPRLNLDSAAAV